MTCLVEDKTELLINENEILRELPEAAKEKLREYKINYITPDEDDETTIRYKNLEDALSDNSFFSFFSNEKSKKLSEKFEALKGKDYTDLFFGDFWTNLEFEYTLGLLAQNGDLEHYMLVPINDKDYKENLEILNEMYGDFYSCSYCDAEVEIDDNGFDADGNYYECEHCLKSIATLILVYKPYFQGDTEKREIQILTIATNMADLTLFSGNCVYESSHGTKFFLCY